MNIYMAVIAAITIVIWGISVFCFRKITVDYIEAKMAQEGRLPPSWDQGFGTRLPMYAQVIIFPNWKRKKSLVDINSILRHKRKVDWYLAVFMTGTFNFLLLQMIAFYIFYGPVE